MPTRTDHIADPVFAVFDRRQAQPQRHSDGYITGQRDRATALDFFGRWGSSDDCLDLFEHAAHFISGADGDAICDGLVDEGLLDPDWINLDPREMLTEAGKQAYAAVRQNIAALDAKIAALPAPAPTPPLPVAFALRRAAFGPVTL